MPQPIDAATFRRLCRHEAQVHAVPGRELRDLGDGLLLYDPIDPEPFWNRLAAITWPSEPSAFDRRLAEIAILFASIGRQPHLWTSPDHDAPADLVARLTANGFVDTGAGLLLIADDPAASWAALAVAPSEGVEIERHSSLAGLRAKAVADIIVSVLLDAFEVGPERRDGVIEETVASLADPRFTHYVGRQHGTPVAAARRATFDGLTYISSIGVMPAARGLGLGRLITARATADAFDAGSTMAHLGVFEENLVAKRLYEHLGYRPSGRAGPDMILLP